MTQPREPGEQRPADPNEATRRLERAPGERYASPKTEAERRPSLLRGLAIALLVAIGGAVVMAFLAGQLAISSGLLVIAVAIGRFVGLAIRTARRAIRPGSARIIALVIAVSAVVLAQVGIWLYARSEGGVLGFLDYLGETFGPLVLLEVLLAAVIAPLSAD